MIVHNDYPLFTATDIACLLDMALDNKNTHIIDSLCQCINLVIDNIDINMHINKINELHNIKPKLIKSSEQIAEEIKTRREESEKHHKQWQNEQKNREKDNKHTQSSIDCRIKNIIESQSPKPELFVELACLLDYKNGMRARFFLDLRQSPGWEKLTSEEKDIAITLAENYVKHAGIEVTAPGQLHHTVAQALILLMMMRPEAYNKLDKECWKKCSVELFKSAFNNNIEQLAPLVDTLSTKFNDVATDAIINVLRQEISQGDVNFIHLWGKRITQDQVDAIMKIATSKELEKNQSISILEALNRNENDEPVKSYLSSLFSDQFFYCQKPEYNRHLSLAFSLNPNKYAHNIIKAIRADIQWGRQWIEAIVLYDTLPKAIFACSPDVVKDFYIWLHEQYPFSTRQNHDTAYTQDAIDKIHDLKNSIINGLIEVGSDESVKGLEAISKAFADHNDWMQSCIIDARSAARAKSIVVLSTVDITRLCDPVNASRRLAVSIHDLSTIVLDTLNRYQTHLQGDTPANNDLWNTTPPIRPKDEGSLSDHLTRYLLLVLPPTIIANREVEISRKLFQDGEAGSRTDLWVQLPTDNTILTLCIEVKCNWNDSAKTAIKDQLINKYMTGGTAQAGILLLGWYDCTSWDRKHRAKKSPTKTWPDILSARIDLEKQTATERKSGHFVSAVVIDCSLT